MRSIVTAEELQAEAHGYALALVRHEQSQTGSRMSAYRKAAAPILWSASKLRKLIGRQAITIEAHEFLNLAQAYERLCARIEARADLAKRRADAAQERLNAAHARHPLAHSRDMERVANRVR